MKYKPKKDGIWKSLGNEETVVCPNCGEATYIYIPEGRNTSIDTIGSVKICSSEKGTYIHGD